MQPKQALARAVAGCLRAFSIGGAFSLGINLLMLTVPIYMMQMFDRVVPSRNFDTLMWLTLIAVVALGVMAALDGVRGRMMVRLAIGRASCRERVCLYVSVSEVAVTLKKKE